MASVSDKWRTFTGAVSPSLEPLIALSLAGTIPGASCR